MVVEARRCTGRGFLREGVGSTVSICDDLYIKGMKRFAIHATSTEVETIDDYETLGQI